MGTSRGLPKVKSSELIKHSFLFVISSYRSSGNAYLCPSVRPSGDSSLSRVQQPFNTSSCLEKERNSTLRLVFQNVVNMSISISKEGIS